MAKVNKIKCLWAISHSSYSKREQKEKAYEDISSIEIGMDVDAIKAKWNSLRTQYNRELAKENRSRRVKVNIYFSRRPAKQCNAMVFLKRLPAMECFRKFVFQRCLKNVGQHV